jgi:hypothetical protein
LVQALLRHLCDDPALCSSSAAKCTEAAFFFLVDRGVDVCALRDAFCRAALAGNVPLVERFIARGFTIEFGEFLLRGGCKALTELIAKHSGGKCLDAALHLCLQDLDVERSLFLVKLGAKLAPPHRMMQGTYDVLTGAIAAGLMSIGGDDWRWFLTNGASWPAVQDPLFDLLCCVGTPSFLLFLMLDAVPCAAPFADPFCFAAACWWGLPVDEDLRPATRTRAFSVVQRAVVRQHRLLHRWLAAQKLKLIRWRDLLCAAGAQPAGVADAADRRRGVRAGDLGPRPSQVGARDKSQARERQSMNFSALLLFAGAARHQSLRLAHTAVLHRSCEKRERDYEEAFFCLGRFC